MKKLLSVILAVALVACCIPAIFASAANDMTIYLASSGDDANAGTQDKPVKTLAKAAELAAKADSLTILVLSGTSYEIADAEGMPQFACPTTIKSADKNSKATLKFSAHVSIYGELTLDDIVVESNHTYIFNPREGAKFVFAAGCELVKVGNYNWILNSEPADITVMTGAWDYLYCTGKLTVGGDAGAKIAVPVYNYGPNEYKDNAIVIDTTGVIDSVYGGGLSDEGLRDTIDVTLINGTVGELYAGAHPQTSGGVAGDAVKKGTIKEVNLNICGGEIVKILSYEGSRKNNYADGSPVCITPDKVNLTIYGAKGKATFEAVAEKAGTEPQVVYSDLEKPAEKKPVEEDKTEDKTDDEGAEKPAETGDPIAMFALISVVSLAGVVAFRKVSAR